MFSITGILKTKLPEQQVSEKFRKREFVITENSSQYPQVLMFQLTQDRCTLIDSAREGDEIKVHFNLRGREWQNPQGETKYFGSLEAWKIESAAQGAPSNQGPPAQHAPMVSSSEPQSSQPPVEDDLPF